MFAYAMLGTNDLDRAVRFYTPLMAMLGQPRCGAGAEEAIWGSGFDPAVPTLCVGRPFDRGAASAGNGAMLAFRATHVGLVDQLHAAAIEAGGTDEGGPGLRPQYGPGFYAAYGRDPDGNKLAFVCFGSDHT